MRSTRWALPAMGVMVALAVAGFVTAASPVAADQAVASAAAGKAPEKAVTPGPAGGCQPSPWLAGESIEPPVEHNAPCPHCHNDSKCINLCCASGVGRCAFNGNCICLIEADPA